MTDRTPFSSEDIKEMRKLLDLTSEGPWYAYIGKSVMSEPDQTVVAHCPDLQQQPASHNAEFIAHARQDVPRLLDTLEQYRQILEDLLEAGKEIADSAQLGSSFELDSRVQQAKSLLGKSESTQVR